MPESITSALKGDTAGPESKLVTGHDTKIEQKLAKPWPTPPSNTSCDLENLWRAGTSLMPPRISIYHFRPRIIISALKDRETPEYRASW